MVKGVGRVFHLFHEGSKRVGREEDGRASAAFLFASVELTHAWNKTWARVIERHLFIFDMSFSFNMLSDESFASNEALFRTLNRDCSPRPPFVATLWPRTYQ